MADIKDVIRRQEFEASRRAPFTPEIGALVTIELPGEITRAIVERIISPTRIIGRVDQFTTNNKSHDYKKGSLVAAEYRRGAMNLNGWYEIPQSVLDAANRDENPMVEVEAAEPAEPREMVEGDFSPPPKRKGK